ncbi:MAG: hypothetical protein HY294_02065 [Candidatus Rokubacteria bacterium]|nr:hypothetical protein [Candidatus Rokubacteria bacterium]
MDYEAITTGFQQWVHICERCGERMEERHCKIVCNKCGLTRDCSDP